MAPPKTKAVAIPTSEDIKTIYEDLHKEKPKEEDFEKIIAAAGSDDTDVKKASSRIIPEFIKKFKDLEPKALDALQKLVKDDSRDVILNALSGLKDYIISSEPVLKTVMESVCSSEEQIAEKAKTIIKEALSKDEEFKKQFITKIPSQKDSVKDSLLTIVQSEYKFTEEDHEPLITLLQNIKITTENTIKLMRRYAKIIPEEDKKKFSKSAYDFLSQSLDKKFIETTKGLLITSLTNIKGILPESGHIMDLVATKVFSQLDELNIDTKIKIIQLIAQHASVVENPKLLEEIYKKVFMSFPTEYTKDSKIYISLIEATLFAFFRLSQNFSKTASQLTGKIQVSTGQPSETAGVESDENKTAEFHKRLQAMNTMIQEFITRYINQKKSLSEKDPTLSEEERIQKGKDSTIAIRLGKNIKRFSEILQKDNFVTERPPSDVSWKVPKSKRADNKGSRKQNSYHKNDRYDRNQKKRFSSDRRNDRRTNTHGRNGSRKPYRR